MDSNTSKLCWKKTTYRISPCVLRDTNGTSYAIYTDPRWQQRKWWWSGKEPEKAFLNEARKRAGVRRRSSRGRRVSAVSVWALRESSRSQRLFFFSSSPPPRLPVGFPFAASQQQQPVWCFGLSLSLSLSHSLHTEREREGGADTFPLLLLWCSVQDFVLAPVMIAAVPSSLYFHCIYMDHASSAKGGAKET